MSTGGRNWDAGKARAGTLTVLIVASPTSRHILRELADGPKPLGEIRDEEGSPADLDLEYPEGVGAKITPAGKEMLFVNFVLERWLHGAPQGPLTLGSDAANEATAALICGWATTISHALARKPLSFPELNMALESLAYRDLEDQIDALETAGLVEPQEDKGDGEGVRYAVTDWLREGVAPLAAAARWERRQPSEDAAPIEDLDVEAAFHLALPLVRLPAGISGVTRLAVTMPGDAGPRPVGAIAQVEGGQVVSCTPMLQERADAWAVGSAPAWLNAVIEGDLAGIDLGGEERLATTLLCGLHERLFGIPVG